MAAAAAITAAEEGPGAAGASCEWRGGTGRGQAQPRSARRQGFGPLAVQGRHIRRSDRPVTAHASRRVHPGAHVVEADEVALHHGSPVPLLRRGCSRGNQVMRRTETGPARSRKKYPVLLPRRLPTSQPCPLAALLAHCEPPRGPTSSTSSNVRSASSTTSSSLLEPSAWAARRVSAPAGVAAAAAAPALGPAVTAGCAGCCGAGAGGGASSSESEMTITSGCAELGGRAAARKAAAARAAATAAAFLLSATGPAALPVKPRLAYAPPAVMCTAARAAMPPPPPPPGLDGPAPLFAACGTASQGAQCTWVLAPQPCTDRMQGRSDIPVTAAARSHLRCSPRRPCPLRLLCACVDVGLLRSGRQLLPRLDGAPHLRSATQRAGHAAVTHPGMSRLRRSPASCVAPARRHRPRACSWSLRRCRRPISIIHPPGLNMPSQMNLCRTCCTEGPQGGMAVGQARDPLSTHVPSDEKHTRRTRAQCRTILGADTKSSMPSSSPPSSRARARLASPVDCTGRRHSHACTGVGL
jgi:hypothetical protein